MCESDVKLTVLPNLQYVDANMPTCRESITCTYVVRNFAKSSPQEFDVRLALICCDLNGNIMKPTEAYMTSTTCKQPYI